MRFLHDRVTYSRKLEQEDVTMPNEQQSNKLRYSYHVHYVIYTRDRQDGIHRAEILELPVSLESKGALHLATVSLRKAYQENIAHTEIIQLFILDWHRLLPETEESKATTLDFVPRKLASH